MNTSLLQLSAREVTRQLKDELVSSKELIELSLQRIIKVDKKVNAVPILCEKRAVENSTKINKNSLLCGLPILVKDLSPVEGILFVQGSKLFENNIAQDSDPLVKLLEKNGAVVLGKTNTPEFGCGSNTFNDVYGATKNPFDLRLTCGGSSGGAAVALATGETFLATGSDLGGSCRIPAAFCGVVGFRPSPGRTPTNPLLCNPDRNGLHGINGPLARNMADLGLFMDAMQSSSGYPFEVKKDDFSAATSKEDPIDAIAEPPLKIGWSHDLGLDNFVSPEVISICEKALKSISEHGLGNVDNHCPDFKKFDSDNLFKYLRADLLALNFHNLKDSRQSSKNDTNKNDSLIQWCVDSGFKPEVIWNIKTGLDLDEQFVKKKKEEHYQLQEEVVSFFEEFDLLCTPCVITQPFPQKIRYLTSHGKSELFPHYCSWMVNTSVISLTNCPALSIPCGFDSNGIPVGLQIVAKRNNDKNLLQWATKMETIFAKTIFSNATMQPFLSKGADDLVSRNFSLDQYNYCGPKTPLEAAQHHHIEDLFFRNKL